MKRSKPFSRLFCLLLAVPFLLFLKGCATASLTGGLDARSIPKNTFQYDQQFSIYSGSSVNRIQPSIRVGYGLSENWSTYLLTDVNSVNLTAKYSFLNQREENGVSAAILLGTVYLGNQFSPFSGATISWLEKPLEVFVGYRFAYVFFNRNNLDPNKLSSPPPSDFSLHLLNLGVRWWWTESLASHLEVAMPIANSYLTFSDFTSTTIALTFLF